MWSTREMVVVEVRGPWLAGRDVVQLVTGMEEADKCRDRDESQGWVGARRISRTPALSGPSSPKYAAAAHRRTRSSRDRTASNC